MAAASRLGRTDDATDASGRSGLLGAVVAAAPRSSRQEDAVVATASRLGPSEGDGDNGTVAEERPGLSDAVVVAASRPEGVVAMDTPRSEHTDDAESIERL